MLIKSPELAGKTAWLTLPVVGSSAGRMSPVFYFEIFSDGKRIAAEQMPLTAKPVRLFPYPVQVGDDGAVELRFFEEPGGDSMEDPDFCSLMTLSAEPFDADMLYREALRPLVHFTPSRGFMNDPNGLTYYEGTYFLFFQLNPYGVTHGNTHWGLAKSNDLLHWKEEAPVLAPDETGAMFSGSGVVDAQNTSGFGDGVTPPILLFYTATGMRFRPKLTFDADGKPIFPRFRFSAAQRGAVSTDGGKTFRKLPGDPLVPHIEAMNRDPKVVWNRDAGCWVMMLYLNGNDYTLLYSPDLLHWERGQTLTFPGTGECPDLFELCLDGDPARRKWILFGSPENYVIGRFEGKEFVAETPLIKGCTQPEEGEVKVFTSSALYAPQTFSSLPEGRIVQISWMPTVFPDAGFQSQMSLPWELRLVSTSAGPRLSKLPAAECLTLRKSQHAFTSDDPATLKDAAAEALELEFKADFDGTEGGFAFSLRGVLFVYDHRLRRLTTPTGDYPLPFAEDQKLSLRIIADRGSVEFFTGDGLFNCGLNAVLDPSRKTAELLYARGCHINGTVYTLGL